MADWFEIWVLCWVVLYWIGLDCIAWCVDGWFVVWFTLIHFVNSWWMVCTSGMKEDPSCPLISSQKLPKTSKSSQNTYKRPFLHSKLGWELKRSLACHKNHHVACFRFVPLMTSSSILNEFEWMVLLENLPSLVFCYKKESIAWYDIDTRHTPCLVLIINRWYKFISMQLITSLG